MENFITELSGTDVSIYGDKDERDLNGNVTVRWAVDMEIRDWGIKGISAYVIDVDVRITDEEDENVLFKDLKLESEIEMIDDMIQVSDVYIDLKESTITIS